MDAWRQQVLISREELYHCRHIANRRVHAHECAEDRKRFIDRGDAAIYKSPHPEQ